MCEVLIYNEFLNRTDWERLREDEDMHSSPFNPTPLQDLRRWADQNKSKFTDLKNGARKVLLNGAMANTIKFLHPYYADYAKLEAKGLNDTSVVTRVTSSGASALLTGDLEPTGWRALLENSHGEHFDIHSDVLKFPHHGGKWGISDTESLLSVVQPSVVILSVGTAKGETYGHPNKEVFEVLSSPLYSHIRVLCTQATSQCCESATNHRNSIIQCLDASAHSRGQERIGSKSGCPCAGTVVIELGDKASVLQPSQVFHQDKIIRPHFFKHKCVFP